MKCLLQTGITLLSLIFIISCERTGNNSSPVATQTVTVFGQGAEGGIVNGAEASLLRTADNGIFVDLSMPLPEPSSYHYPEDTESGHPEVFTLWVFVSNNPDAEGFDAAYLGSVHVAGDTQTISLNGHITTQSKPFTGDGQLEDSMGAKIWLRVAPHGILNADKLPGQLTTPSGSPEHWWYADFE